MVTAMNIDWQFITRLEGGQKLTAYVPGRGSLSDSGVTVATGFDLGQRNLGDLKRIKLDGSIVSQLVPYLGVKGMAAQRLLDRNVKPLKILPHEADQIDKKEMAYFKGDISKKYNMSISSIPNSKQFSKLSRETQTVIASVAWQYGTDLKKATPRFWGYVTKQDWLGAYKELMNFGDAHASRRQAEARYLKRWLDAQRGP